MSSYNSVAIFGSVPFQGRFTPTEQPSTLKSNNGKAYTEKQIFARNSNDTVIKIEGVLTGRSQTSAQTKAEAIESERTSLLALNDGYYHSYNDGRHSGNYVIVTGSLTFDDDPENDTGQPQMFNMVVQTW